MKRPEYVIAPEGCERYLTPGRRYKVLNPVEVRGEFWGFDFVDDDGTQRGAIFRASSHLSGQNWIIPDDKPEDEKPSLQEEIIAVHTEALIAHNEALQELQKRAEALQADFDELTARMSDRLTEAAKPDDGWVEVMGDIFMCGFELETLHNHPYRYGKPDGTIEYGVFQAQAAARDDDASASVNLLCKLAGVDVSFKHVHDVRASFAFAGPDSAEISEITLRVKV